MATRLHQVLTFPAVAPGGQQSVAHLINWNGRAVIPDRIFADQANGSFTVISVDSAQMTVRNDGGVAADFVFWLESLHSILRAFGATPPPEFLVPLPFLAGGGASSGSGGSNLQAFRYTVTGLEPDTSDFTVILPAARVTDVYRIAGDLAGAVSIVGLDFPDLIAGDRTTTQFRVVATGSLTAGDQLDFFVSDPVA